MHSCNRIDPVFTRVTLKISHKLIIDHKTLVIYFGYYSHLLPMMIRLQKQI